MKKKEITVAAIVPIYNTPDWMVRACLNSLLEQSYKLNEIIVIDDGSTDKHTLECEEEFLLYKQIKLIKKIHSGISDARNAGIDTCQSDYFVFVDSDDLVLEDYILKYVRLLEKEEYDYIVGSGHRIDYDGTDKMEGIYPDRAVIGDPNRFPYYMLTTGPKIFKTDFINRIECRFPSGCMNEDETFSLFTSVCAKKVAAVGYSGYCVRNRQISTCRDRRTHNTATVENVSFAMLEKILERSLGENEYTKSVISLQVAASLFSNSSIFATYSSRSERRKLIEQAVFFIRKNGLQLVHFKETNKKFKATFCYLFPIIIFVQLARKSLIFTRLYIGSVVLFTRLVYKVRGQA